MTDDPLRQLNDGITGPQMPRSWKVLGYFFLALTACVLLLIAFASISRKESVGGILTSTQGEIRLISARGGILTKKYVKEGDEIVKGQPLVEISTEQDSNKESFNAQILGAIDAQIRALQDQIIAYDKSAPIEIKKLQEHLASERAQLRLLRESVPDKAHKRDLAEETLKRGRGVAADGAISRLQLQAFEFEYLDNKQAISDLELKISQLSDATTADEMSLRKLPEDQKQARSAIVENIENLKQKQVSAIGESGYVLRANISGRVSSMQAKIGQSIDSAQPLLTILPKGSTLCAQVYVPSRAIGFLKVGQKVRIMYDAFPYQKFGAAEGVVNQISSTVLKPNEIATAASISEPSYGVEIALSKSTISAFGKTIHLVPGMALKADIILEKQNLLSLLFESIWAAPSRV